MLTVFLIIVVLLVNRPKNEGNVWPTYFYKAIRFVINLCPPRKDLSATCFVVLELCV